MSYNELTWRHFTDARCAGVLTVPGAHRGAAGSPAAGTWVQFDVQVDWAPTISRVKSARFLAYGCPHVIAVADWVAQTALGGEAAPRLPESVQALRARFDMPIGKLGRLLILEDAWIAAVSSPHGVSAPGNVP